MSAAPDPTFSDSAAVRDYLVEALRLDLIGPRPGDDALRRERLPHAPSRWYLTGFLAPTGAPEAWRAQDAEEELDEPSEPTQGGDDASTPERGSGKRVFLPSSMGLSVLVDESARHLRVELSWGDYMPEEDAANDAATASGKPRSDAATEIEEPDNGAATEGEASDSEEAKAGPARYRFAPWVRRPRAAAVDIDLASIQVGSPVRLDVAESGGLELVCLVRPTRVRGSDGKRDARAFSVFLVNRRRAAENDDLQDTAFAFQVEMSLAADRPFIPRYDPRGIYSDDWDERLADLHYRDAAEYAVGHNVSVRTEVSDAECVRVHTEWMPQAVVERVEPSPIPHVEFGMEVLGALDDAGRKRSAR